MISDIVKIDNQGLGMEEALDVTEKIGEFGGLDSKKNIRLRLLAEELIGLMRGIAGNIKGDFWVEKHGQKYILHLKSDIDLSREMREKFINVSTSGTNSAAKGFMGKIRDIIATSLLPTEDIEAAMISVPMGYMSLGSQGSFESNANIYLWSLQNYKNSLNDENTVIENKEEAWDELEKSIVASIADDVQVSVKGTTVEIAIYKNF